MIRIAVVALCALLPGCHTLAGAEAAKGSGMTRTYVESRDVVWKAVVSEVGASKLELVKASEAEGKILAQHGFSFASWGEYVAIWIEQQSPPPGTRVEIVSKRKMITNFFAPHWGRRLFAKLDLVLTTATGRD